MKRELKFRSVFFTFEGKFSHFTYWGFLNHKDEYNEDCFKSPSSSSAQFRKEEDQFIGIKDKNGKEIYEWDIVQKWHYNKKKWIAIVEHIDYIDSKIDGYKGKNVSGFYLVNDDWDYPNEEFVDIEVIGNIYENPELL